jgi:hypothetical protein
MGIKQLFQIIKDEAPDAIKEGEIKNQFGRKVAIVGCASKIYAGVLANFLQGCVWIKHCNSPIPDSPLTML